MNHQKTNTLGLSPRPNALLSAQDSIVQDGVFSIQTTASETVRTRKADMTCWLQARRT